MADISKGRLLFGGVIHHTTATSLFMRGSKQVLLEYVILFKHVNFQQYFACLRE